MQHMKAYNFKWIIELYIQPICSKYKFNLYIKKFK